MMKYNALNRILMTPKIRTIAVQVLYAIDIMCSANVHYNRYIKNNESKNSLKNHSEYYINNYCSDKNLNDIPNISKDYLNTFCIANDNSKKANFKDTLESVSKSAHLSTNIILSKQDNIQHVNVNINLIRAIIEDLYKNDMIAQSLFESKLESTNLKTNEMFNNIKEQAWEIERTEKLERMEIITTIVTITSNMIKIMTTIDHNISKYLAENWKLERLSKVLQVILRLGIYEIMTISNDIQNQNINTHNEDIVKLHKEITIDMKKNDIAMIQNKTQNDSNNVSNISNMSNMSYIGKIIRSYMEIAKWFGHQREVSFVNGVLHNFAIASIESSTNSETNSENNKKNGGNKNQDNEDNEKPCDDKFLEYKIN